MTRTENTGRRLCLAIGAASLCLCILLDLFYFPAGTIFPDERRFLASATQMSETGRFIVRGDRAWEMPGTAAFFAAFILLFSGANAAIVPIRLAQAMLLVFQAALIGKIAQRMFHDRVTGLAAFTIAAFYPFLLYYQGLLLSETLFNTFLIAAFACLYWWRDRGLRMDGTLILTSVCFALATYTKPTLTLLPPFLVAAVTLGARDWRLTGRMFLVSALIYLALLAPWWLRNYSLLHAFVPFTTGSAQILYLGNNPSNPSVGISWSDTDPAVLARLRAIPDEAERQRAFRAEAMRYIVEDPGAFVHRMSLKLLRFWNIVPNAPEFSGGGYKIVSVVSFGPVLVLALVATVLWRRRFVAFAPLLVLVAYFTLMHMITIASLRYRLPLEPFLIVLAAAPVGAVLRRATGWR